MREIDAFKPFDTQSLRPVDWYDIAEMKCAINMLVAEVKELKSQLEICTYCSWHNNQEGSFSCDCKRCHQ